MPIFHWNASSNDECAIIYDNVRVNYERGKDKLGLFYRRVKISINAIICEIAIRETYCVGINEETLFILALWIAEDNDRVIIMYNETVDHLRWYQEPNQEIASANQIDVISSKNWQRFLSLNIFHNSRSFALKSDFYKILSRKNNCVEIELLQERKREKDLD